MLLGVHGIEACVAAANLAGRAGDLAGSLHAGNAGGTALPQPHGRDTPRANALENREVREVARPGGRALASFAVAIHRSVVARSEDSAVLGRTGCAPEGRPTHTPARSVPKPPKRGCTCIAPTATTCRPASRTWSAYLRTGNCCPAPVFKIGTTTCRSPVVRRPPCDRTARGV